MAETLRLVLGDQLTRGVAALRDAQPGRDAIVMAEVDAEATYVKHHKKKIALIFAGMRRFAERLRGEGFTVRYTRIGDPGNSHSLAGEVRAALRETGAERVIATRCGEWRLDTEMRDWARALNRPVEIREDDRFLCSIADFRAWAKGRAALRMEFFYRQMRVRTGLLMDGDEPVGGRWNYDAENRGKPGRGVAPPPPRVVAPDAITREAIAEVAARYPEHFGALEPWTFATGAEDAEVLFGQFLEEALPSFGAYQDAMLTGQPFMWHAIISMYLNIGFLDPLEVCRRAELQYRKGLAPLNAVEGFIRQILGWREYVRGIYWTFMPEYADRNALDARGRLPWFYWSAETEMTCLREAVAASRDFAYAHHIQRLMVTGNFALLAGVDPREVNEWYLVVYADAYEWVELPNTHGMALYADGGAMASKPYAASGAYINRMSDHCGRCRYDVKKTTGPGACPFNALYWDFLMRHEGRFRANPRMAMPLKNLDRKTDAERTAIQSQARAYLVEFGVLEEG